MSAMNHERQLKELGDLALPLRNWLEKNYHPHAAVVITVDGATVVEDSIHVPYAYLNDKKDEERERGSV